MPAVTLSTVVDLSKIKMKWKEQYVSEGLNHKTASTLANGVYKGLTLVQNISSARMVSISVGSDSVHAAVYQSADGFSLTYFDVAGSTYALDLSNASLDNQETVIVLEIAYTVGADTTANWVAYPIADWNALSSAAQAERIVLGTINVPAPATNITTSMINMKRRSWAWENATGDLSWSPVVKNGTFEHAEINATTDYSASYWRFGNLGTAGFQAAFKVQNTSAHLGTNCLVVDHQTTGLQSTEAEQYIGARVTGGQLFKYKFFLQNLKIPVSGNGLRVTFRFVRADMVTEDDVLVVTALSSIDASYREISDTVAVPSTSAFLVSVYIDYTNNQSTTGIALRIDDLQVWLQTTGATAPVSEARVQQFTHTGAVVLEDNDDPFADFFGEAIMLRNKATELRIERRDFNRTTGSPVLISPTNAVFQKLGEDLLNTEARALVPRFTVPVSTTGGVDFTLMWESVPTSQVGYRKYISATGQLIETMNAKWTGTAWQKDVSGTAAVKATLSTLEGRRDLRQAANNTNWSDGSWDLTVYQQSWASQTVQFIADMLLLGNLSLANNASITLSGASGDLKHGDRVTVHPAMLLNTGGTSWSSQAGGAVGVNNALAATILLSGFRVGDRIKSIQPRVLGDGATNFQYGLRKLEDGGGNVQANATYTPPASWGFAPAQTITSPTIIAAGQSYCVIVGLLSASGSITISTISVTHDHP